MHQFRGIRRATHAFCVRLLHLSIAKTIARPVLKFSKIPYHPHYNGEGCLTLSDMLLRFETAKEESLEKWKLDQRAYKLSLRSWEVALIYNECRWFVRGNRRLFHSGTTTEDIHRGLTEGLGKVYWFGGAQIWGDGSCRGLLPPLSLFGLWFSKKKKLSWNLQQVLGIDSIKGRKK